MSVLHRYPFNRDEVPCGAGAVLLWWESRRLAYNIVIGITGVVSVSLLVVNSLIRGDDCGIPLPPLFALLLIIGYGVMANICGGSRSAALPRAPWSVVKARLPLGPNLNHALG